MSNDLVLPVLPPAPPRAKAAQNVFWLVAERTVKAVGGVGMGVLIARHLGPDQYGRYGAAIGLSTLAKDAVMLGFDRMIRRDIAVHPERGGKNTGDQHCLGFGARVHGGPRPHRARRAHGR